jgi:hypothetical protein
MKIGKHICCGFIHWDQRKLGLFSFKGINLIKLDEIPRHEEYGSKISTRFMHSDEEVPMKDEFC